MDYRSRTRPRRMRRNKPVWKTANELLMAGNDTSTEAEADTSADEAGSTATAQPNTLRSNLNMNSFAAAQQQQPTRQTPRLQNTNKTGLGNGSGSGWGGFGMPSSGTGGAVGGGGFGGLGGVAAAPGLGQPRPGQLSGFAQVMGGGGQQGPIDMSDFPSLSGGPRPQQSNSTATGWNSSAIRQPPVQQQQSQAPQPQQQRAPSAAPSQQSIDQFDGQRSQQPSSADRAGGGDDFPPLGGGLGGGVNGDAFGQPPNGVNNGNIGSPEMQQPRINGQQSQLPIRESSATYQQTPQLPNTQQQATSQSQPQPPSNAQPPPVSSGVKKYGDMTEKEKWGLPGLMAAFEARRQAEGGGQVDDTLPMAMRSAIIMGHDLNSLGMDLDSAEPLYPTFTPFQAIGSSGSTFDFHERQLIPDFTLPSAYTVTNVPPLSSRTSAMSDETLFSIFYQNPRDTLQEHAATELIAREWRWHKLLRQWLQKDTRETSSSSLPLVDLTNGAPVGTQPIKTSERGEKGVYVFFDAMNWRRERRWLELDYEYLETGRVGAGVGASGNGNGSVGVGERRLQTGGGGEGGRGVGSSQIPGA
ncbi:transcriptional regulator [Vermiconidia calcicola]|uniref:Transcriptional regulator n=1 Tax=Vermiconidia calcicola TaxID=1690605 RepID=A0ACC3MIZ7_9PEZI|nr:transcriptional regulator [Vermiconidia calcicola]